MKPQSAIKDSILPKGSLHIWRIFFMAITILLAVIIFMYYKNHTNFVAVSDEFQEIREYHVSTDSQSLLLLVPDGNYLSSSGLESWQIVSQTLLEPDYNTVYKGSISSQSMYNIRFANTSDRFYFLQNSTYWDDLSFGEMNTIGYPISLDPFLFTHFEVDYANNKIVAWSPLEKTQAGNMQPSPNGNIAIYSASQLSLITEIDLYEIIGVEVEILHVEWSKDGKQLLAHIRSEQTDNLIVLINLLNLDVHPVIKKHGIFTQFGWDSERGLIAIAHHNGIGIYNTKLECFVKEILLDAHSSQPQFHNGVLFFVLLKYNQHVIQSIDIKEEPMTICIN